MNVLDMICMPLVFLYSFPQIDNLLIVPSVNFKNVSTVTNLIDCFNFFFIIKSFNQQSRLLRNLEMQENEGDASN